jgi:hypothetical protein
MDIIEKINDIPEGLNVTSSFDRNKINVAKIVHNDGSLEYIYLDENQNKSLKVMEGSRIEPIMLYGSDKIKFQRAIYYTYGTSGKGKSLIAFVYSIQYHKLYPHDRIFYVCATDINDDENFSELDYVKQLDPEKIYDINMPTDDERELIKRLSDSLFIFDDIDMLPVDKKKIYTRFQFKLIEVGRKYNINLLIITHINLGGHNTKMILNEIDQYFTFKDTLENNGYLLKYLKMKQEDINKIKTSSWVCVNNKYGLIITPQSIMYKKVLKNIK